MTRTYVQEAVQIYLYQKQTGYPMWGYLREIDLFRQNGNDPYPERSYVHDEPIRWDRTQGSS